MSSIWVSVEWETKSFLFIIRGKSRAEENTSLIHVDGCRYNERRNDKMEGSKLLGYTTQGSVGKTYSKPISGDTWLRTQESWSDEDEWSWGGWVWGGWGCVWCVHVISRSVSMGGWGVNDTIKDWGTVLIIRGKWRDLKRIYIDGCRYNERLNSERRDLKCLTYNGLFG